MKDFIAKILIPTANGESLKPYGVFHCIWLALTIAGMVAAVYFTLKKEKKTLYFLYVLSSILMWTGEIYKQFTSAFETGVFNYQWYDFPFQFCSTPLYTFLFCAIAKKGKAYDAVSVYNGTYALFAGTMVIIYPSTLVANFGISTQSLLHHALMMVTGVSALVEYGKKMSIKLFLQGMLVYVILFAIAIVLNFALPAITGQNVNMYFVSKTYPVDGIPSNPFKVFQQAYPYPLFLLVYSLIFTDVACLMAYLSHVVASKKTQRA